jgi:hypothetical protein
LCSPDEGGLIEARRNGYEISACRGQARSGDARESAILGPCGYYAGFTHGFVEDMLQRLDVDSSPILDPWNGGGTTTAAAVAAGRQAIGYDINPAAVLLGRAQLITQDVAPSMLPIAVEICRHARANPYERDPEADPLAMWFGPESTRALRTLERAIFRILVDEDAPNCGTVYNPALPHSTLAAGLYVSLFRTVRELARRYVPTNPTWIKKPDGRRLVVRESWLHSAFVSAVRGAILHPGPLKTGRRGEETPVMLAASSRLPLPDGSVGAVIASPPYCTRIDYVKATLPELAVMGLTGSAVRLLRDTMIGTPTMKRGAIDLAPQECGEAVRELLERISAHPSKASGTYYKKYFQQYFDGMSRSLAELRRVMKPGCAAVLVVQDSYYKEIHVDLPALIGEMSQACGWSDWSRQDFKVARTMAQINPASRQYRQQFRAVESAVTLRT